MNLDVRGAVLVLITHAKSESITERLLPTVCTSTIHSAPGFTFSDLDYWEICDSQEEYIFLRHICVHHVRVWWLTQPLGATLVRLVALGIALHLMTWKRSLTSVLTPQNCEGRQRQ